MTTTIHDRFIDEKEATVLTGLSRTTRWRLARTGEFPRKVKLSPGRSAYRLSDLKEWADARQA